MDTSGGVIFIRSINADHPTRVTFVNTTLHEVEVFWINYNGQAVHYGTLGPGKSLNVTTFVTHPWIFVEAQSMERFVVEGKDVFYPRRSEQKPQSTAFIAAITSPMYSLREIAMKAVKLLLLDDNDAYRLDIPKNLQRELAKTTPQKNRL